MGVGGSTNSRPGSATVLVKSRPPNELPSRTGSAHQLTSHNHVGDRPTGSCCSHFRKNHTTLTQTASPATDPPPPPHPEDSIDEDIEEIVANSLDLVSQTQKTTHSERSTSGQTGDTDRDFEVRSRGAASGVELRKTLRSSSRVVQKRPSDEIEEQFDAKDNVPEVDFAKFKKVNHRGTTIAPNGRIMHHQESDLLWRLGLISPEAYKMNTGPRSAPTHNQGAYLKTPSYDLTEEQLMANIEKEFNTTTSIRNEI